MPVNLLQKLFSLLLFLAALVGLMRLTAVRWWRVPSDDPDLTASIAPTLWPGDLVLLWRLTEPGVGALVLCPDPDAPDEPLVARIAGRGGDHVELDDRGDLAVTGQRVRADKACNDPRFVVKRPNNGQEIEMTCEVETLGGIHHRRGVRGNAATFPRSDQVDVRDGYVYLVSDNRLLPFDSRDYGELRAASCRERVFFRLVGAAGFSDVSTRLSWID